MTTRNRALALSVFAIVLLAAPSALAGGKVYETRGEIPEAYRWNLGDIFPTIDAWEACVAGVEATLPKLTAYKGTLGKRAKVLAEAMALRYETERKLESIYVYAGQWSSTDTRLAEAKTLMGRARGLHGKLSEATAFMEPEIVGIPDKKMAKLRKAKELATYDHLLDDMLRVKAHIRSGEVEEVLAGASLLMSAPSSVRSSLYDADIQWPEIKGPKGEKITATPSLFYQLLAHDEREVRKDAALAIFGTYETYANTLASALAGSIQKDVWLAKTRRYGSTLEMALDADNVPREVIDTLVRTVHERSDVLHRYTALRKKLLGVEAVHIYDLYVNLAPGGDKAYPFDEGWELAMAFWRETFGEDYAAAAERALKERWVDVYPNKGKRGGAYSWGTYDAHPYLFLNYGDTLEDVFTLVHEMGHSIHSYLANAAQPYHLAEYSLFVAELASVASESLFYEWLLARTTEPKERMALLSVRINGIVGTFLRQIFFHEFEAAAHAMAERGEPLTKDALGRVWGDLWLSYYGPDAALDEEYRTGWARVSHYFRRFYVWKYATSFAAGEAIAARFRAGEASAVGDYLETLKLGGSVYPMDALRRAGVELTDPRVIETVMVRFEETLDALEAGLKQ